MAKGLMVLVGGAHPTAVWAI